MARNTDKPEVQDYKAVLMAKLSSVQEEIPVESSDERGDVVVDWVRKGEPFSAIEALESESGEKYIHTDVYAPVRFRFHSDRSGTSGYDERASAADVPFHTFECPFGLTKKSRVRVDTAVEAAFLYEAGLRGDLDWNALYRDLQERGNIDNLSDHDRSELLDSLRNQFRWMREQVQENSRELRAMSIVASSLLVPDSSYGRSVYDSVYAPAPAHILDWYLRHPEYLSDDSPYLSVSALTRRDRKESVRFSVGKDVTQLDIVVVGSDTVGGRVPGLKAVPKKTYVRDSRGWVRKDKNGKAIVRTTYEMPLKSPEEREADYEVFSARLDAVLSSVPEDVNVRFVSSKGYGVPELLNRYVEEHGGNTYSWNYSRHMASVSRSDREVSSGSRFSLVQHDHFDEVYPVLVGVDREVSFLLDDKDENSGVSFSVKDQRASAAVCFTVQADLKNSLLLEKGSLAVSGGLPVIHVMENASEEVQKQTLDTGAILSYYDFTGGGSFAGSLFEGETREVWSLDPAVSDVLVDRKTGKGSVVPFVFQPCDYPVQVAGVSLNTFYSVYAAVLLDSCGVGGSLVVQKVRSLQGDPAGLVRFVGEMLSGHDVDDSVRESSMRKAVHLLCSANSSLQDFLAGSAGKDIVIVSSVKDGNLFTDLSGRGENRFGVVLASERDDIVLRRDALKQKFADEQAEMLRESQRLQKKFLQQFYGCKVENWFDNVPEAAKGAVCFLGTDRPVELALQDSTSFEYWEEEFFGADPLNREVAGRPTVLSVDGGSTPNEYVFLYPTTYAVLTGKDKPSRFPSSLDLKDLKRVDPKTGKEFDCAFGIPVKKNGEYWEPMNSQGMPCSFLLDKDSDKFFNAVVAADAAARYTAFSHGMTLMFPAVKQKYGPMAGEYQDCFSRNFKEKIWDYQKTFEKVDFSTGRVVEKESRSKAKSWVDNPHRSEICERIVRKYCSVLVNGQDYPLNCFFLPRRSYMFPEGDEIQRQRMRLTFTSDLNLTLKLAKAFSVTSGMDIRFPMKDGRLYLGPDIPEEFMQIAEKKVDSFLKAGPVLDNGQNGEGHGESFDDELCLYSVSMRDYALKYMKVPLAADGTDLYIRPDDLVRAFGPFDFSFVENSIKAPLHEMVLVSDKGDVVKLTEKRVTKGMDKGDINKWMRYEKNDECCFAVSCSDASRIPEFLSYVNAQVEAAKSLSVETRLVPYVSGQNDDMGMDGLWNLMPSNYKVQSDGELGDIDILGRPVSSVDMANRFDGTDEERDYDGRVLANDGFMGWVQFRWTGADGHASDWIKVVDKELWQDVVFSNVNRVYNSDTRIVPGRKVLDMVLVSEAVRRIVADDNLRGGFLHNAVQSVVRDDKVVHLDLPEVVSSVSGKVTQAVNRSIESLGLKKSLDAPVNVSVKNLKLGYGF